MKIQEYRNLRNRMDNNLLEEIEEWKLEAKLEDNDRYFYHTRVVNRVLKGQKLYIVGRKGTGKTAISEYLNNFNESGYYSQKLTFKNFPFNKLYELQDNGFTSPNQYITLWKFVIYSTVCKLMASNLSIDINTRQTLQKIYNDDIENALPHAVERWTGIKFDIKILGNGFGVESSKNIEEKTKKIGLVELIF